MKLKTNIYLICLVFSFIAFSSCKGDDEGNRRTANYIHFSVDGSLMPGVYDIRQEVDENDDYWANSGMVTGIVTPNENGEKVAILGFTDNAQNLAVTISVPAKKGIYEMGLSDLEKYISITNTNTNNMGEDYTLLVSKTMSLNVKEIETSTGMFATVRHIKGSFNGVMVHIDSQTDMEYAHTVTGEFEINQFF